MSRLARWEQAAIEQVAEQFSATWTQGESDSPCLTLAGQRIAVRVAAIASAPAACGDLNAPRLRFDKVALRVVGRLQAALAADVADAQVVLFTITAPIRLPSKTAAELERVIRQRLAEAATRAEIDDTICANAVRIRFVEGAGRSAKVIGFVHNPESDPARLLDLAQALIQCIGAVTNPPVSESSSGERWLVIVDEQGLGSIETYRQVHSQLGDWVAGDFRKILLLLRNGQLETLSA